MDDPRLQELCIRLWHREQVQSYVRPPFAVLVTAGPDGSSQTGSQSIIRAVSAGHYPGFPVGGLTAVPSTSLRPRNLCIAD